MATINNEDCPFVLELEIDDEISFKPLPKKQQPQLLRPALQPLNENTLAKTPNQNITPMKSIHHSERKGLPFQGENNPISEPVTPIVAAMRGDCRPQLKLPSPTVPTAQIQSEEPHASNLLVGNVTFLREFDLRLDHSLAPSNLMNCSNLISTHSSFFDTQPSTLLSEHEELLQTKIDDLESRNSELIQENALLEARMSELLASSLSGELSHADIQVKALTDQLEVRRFFFSLSNLHTESEGER
jgi:hypothetical protein